MPFEKGQSGNPSGRKPRAVEDAKASVLARLFDERAETRVIRAMITTAAKGDVSAAKLLLDRKYGKVADQHVVQEFLTFQEAVLDVIADADEETRGRLIDRLKGTMGFAAS
jgi:hypothetical protein